MMPNIIPFHNYCRLDKAKSHIPYLRDFLCLSPNTATLQYTNNM